MKNSFSQTSALKKIALHFLDIGGGFKDISYLD